jgi:hypothetical protein
MTFMILSLLAPNLRCLSFYSPTFGISVMWSSFYSQGSSTFFIKFICWCFKNFATFQNLLILHILKLVIVLKYESC